MSKEGDDTGEDPAAVAANVGNTANAANAVILPIPRIEDLQFYRIPNDLNDERYKVLQINHDYFHSYQNLLGNFISPTRSTTTPVVGLSFTKIYREDRKLELRAAFDFCYTITQSRKFTYAEFCSIPAEDREFYELNKISDEYLPEPELITKLVRKIEAYLKNRAVLATHGVFTSEPTIPFSPLWFEQRDKRAELKAKMDVCVELQRAIPTIPVNLSTYDEFIADYRSNSIDSPIAVSPYDVELYELGNGDTPESVQRITAYLKNKTQFSLVSNQLLIDNLKEKGKKNEVKALFDFCCALEQRGISYKEFLTFPENVRLEALTLYVLYNPDWSKSSKKTNVFTKAVSYVLAPLVVLRSLISLINGQHEEFLGSPEGIAVTAVSSVVIGAWFSYATAHGNYKLDKGNFDSFIQWLKAAKGINSQQQQNANHLRQIMGAFDTSLKTTLSEATYNVIYDHLLVNDNWCNPCKPLVDGRDSLYHYDQSLIVYNDILIQLSDATIKARLAPKIGEHGIELIQQRLCLARQQMMTVILSSLRYHDSGKPILQTTTISELLKQAVNQDYSLSPAAMLDVMEHYDLIKGWLEVRGLNEAFRLIDERNLLTDFAVPLYSDKYVTTEEILEGVEREYIQKVLLQDKERGNKLLAAARAPFKYGSKLWEKFQESRKRALQRDIELQRIDAARAEIPEQPAFYQQLHKTYLEGQRDQKAVLQRSDTAIVQRMGAHLAITEAPTLAAKLSDAEAIVELVDLFQLQKFALSEKTLQQLSTFVNLGTGAVSREILVLEGELSELERTRPESTLVERESELVWEVTEKKQEITRFLSAPAPAEGDANFDQYGRENERLFRRLRALDTELLLDIREPLEQRKQKKKLLESKKRQLACFSTIIYLKFLIERFGVENVAEILAATDFNQLSATTQQKLLVERVTIESTINSATAGADKMPSFVRDKLTTQLLPKADNPFFVYLTQHQHEAGFDLESVSELITWYEAYQKWKNPLFNVINFHTIDRPNNNDPNQHQIALITAQARETAPELSTKAREWLAPNRVNVVNADINPLHLQHLIPTTPWGAAYWRPVKNKLYQWGDNAKKYGYEPFKSWLWGGFRVLQFTVIVAALAELMTPAVFLGTMVVMSVLWVIGLRDQTTTKLKLEEATRILKGETETKSKEHLKEQKVTLAFEQAATLASSTAFSPGKKQVLLQRFYDELKRTQAIESREDKYVITAVEFSSAQVNQFETIKTEYNAKKAERKLKSVMDFLDAQYVEDPNHPGKYTKEMDAVDFSENRFSKPTILNALFPEHRKYNVAKWFKSKIKNATVRNFFSYIWRALTSASFLDGVAYGLLPTLIFNVLKIAFPIVFVSNPLVISILVGTGAAVFAIYFVGSAYSNYVRDQENYQLQCNFDQKWRETLNNRINLQEKIRILRVQIVSASRPGMLQTYLTSEVARLEKMEKKLANLHRLTKVRQIENRLKNISITDTDRAHLLSAVKRLQSNYLEDHIDKNGAPALPKVNDSQEYGLEIRTKLAELRRECEKLSPLIPPREGVWAKTKRWATAVGKFFAPGYKEDAKDFAARSSDAALRGFWPGFRVQVAISAWVVAVPFLLIPCAFVWVCGAFAARNDIRLKNKKIELGGQMKDILVERDTQETIAAELEVCTASVNVALTTAREVELELEAEARASIQPVPAPEMAAVKVKDELEQEAGYGSVMSPFSDDAKLAPSVSLPLKPVTPTLLVRTIAAAGGASSSTGDTKEGGNNFAEIERAGNSLRIRFPGVTDIVADMVGGNNSEDSAPSTAPMSPSTGTASVDRTSNGNTPPPKDDSKKLEMQILWKGCLTQMEETKDIKILQQAWDRAYVLAESLDERYPKGAEEKTYLQQTSDHYDMLMRRLLPTVKDGGRRFSALELASPVVTKDGRFTPAFTAASLDVTTVLGPDGKPIWGKTIKGKAIDAGSPEAAAGQEETEAPPPKVAPSPMPPISDKYAMSPTTKTMLFSREASTAPRLTNVSLTPRLEPGTPNSETGVSHGRRRAHSNPGRKTPGPTSTSS